MRLGACCEYVTRPTLQPSDTQQERNLKGTLAPLLVTVIIASFMTTINTAAEGSLAALGFILLQVSCIGGYVMLWRGVGVQLATSFTLLLAAAGVFILDVNGAARQSLRVWALIVPLVDVALVAELHRAITDGLVISTCLFLVVLTADASVKFGLMDLAAVWREYDVPEACDCTEPPCKLPADEAVATVFAYVSVFLFDFAITRRFAQMQLIATSVDVCDVLTDRIARYEIEAGRDILAGEEGARLPPRLRDSYSNLLDNLDSYKPYLPDSLLLTHDHREESAETEGTSTTRPPGEGATESDVCIVFTDIQSSTALWEGCHQGMYDGLQQHNAILRRAASAHDGYEVKTIGDSFMLAFGNVMSAVSFALEAQTQLVVAEWPAELLQAPLCRRESSGGNTIWNGLRVRIGIHCGTARVERNPVTNRCDYFGPPVNTAARIEGDIRHGGLVGVSDEVMRRLGKSGISELGSPTVSSLGPRKLKGVADTVEISLVLPRDLRLRFDAVKNAADAKGPHQNFMSGRRRSPAPSGLFSGSQASDGNETNARLALQLNQSFASCARTCFSLTRADTLRSGAPLFVSTVERAADVSQGVLQSVLSASCVVTWNAPRACTGHTEQCALFISVVRRRCDALGLQSWTGAAAGTVLSGNLAGGRRRFATVIGGCVELSGVLAAVAEMGRMRALATAPIAQHCSCTNSTTDMRTLSGRTVPVVEILEDAEQEGSDALPSPVNSPSPCLVASFDEATEMTPERASCAKQMMSILLLPLWGLDAGQRACL
eukprot:TRINITY_DN9130_c0_g1_i6.p1 TRINITY_DN9130_c0_g1~~TRINITY_DN9130_c0_g1_i6.p1  ORF type:complete len:776 (+),score=164.34 TRINITY_DN9130_c0_g1_i6:70-2397(+)